MNFGNKKKYELLGEPFGTASAKLRKSIIFRLIQKTGDDICYRCGNKIENIGDLSIEHKESWQLSNTPKESFYDLENIAFSHLHCNIVYSSTENRGENHFWSKLTERNIKDIREKLKTGISSANIAKEYGVSSSTIRDIKSKRIWGWLK